MGIGVRGGLSPALPPTHEEGRRRGAQVTPRIHGDRWTGVRIRSLLRSAVHAPRALCEPGPSMPNPGAPPNTTPNPDRFRKARLSCGFGGPWVVPSQTCSWRWPRRPGSSARSRIGPQPQSGESGHSASGVVDSTTCMPASRKRRSAASASSVKSKKKAPGRTGSGTATADMQSRRI
jgi:hypothetical protein